MDLSLRLWGDPILTTPAANVTQFDLALQRQVDGMVALMSAHSGIGLAAPQAGHLNRVLIWHIDPLHAPQALINPSITWASDDLETAAEGCLSLPGVQSRSAALES